MLETPSINQSRWVNCRLISMKYSGALSRVKPKTLAALDVKSKTRTDHVFSLDVMVDGAYYSDILFIEEVALGGKGSRL